MKVLCINLEPDLSFFAKRGLILDVTYDKCSQIFPAIKSGITTDADGSSVTLYSPDVRHYLETTYKTKYDIILFGWDSKNYGDEFRYSGGQTFRDALTSGSRFATVRIGTPNAEIHEMMHIIGNILYMDMKKYDAVDQMDATTVNGRTYYYYKNDNPEAEDGNYAVTWNSYKKYLSELNNINNASIIPSKTLKMGSTGALVIKLQQLLRSKGYFKYFMNTGFFGRVTQMAVMKFQNDNNLVADGVVGQKTWNKLK